MYLKLLASVLAVATVVFTGTALHFARAVDREAALSAGGTAGAAPAEHASVSALAPVATAAAPDATGAALPSAADPAPGALAVHRLAQLRDPVARAQLLREAVAGQRSIWANLTSYIGLTPEELDRFAQQMAERSLDRRAHLLECEITPGCDLAALQATSADVARANRSELLTPAQFANAEAYFAARKEQSLAGAVGLRLIPQGENLREEGLAALTLALVDARRRFIDETGTEPQGEVYDERLAMAASTVLTPRQMETFRTVQQQERERERERKRREAAGG